MIKKILNLIISLAFILIMPFTVLADNSSNNNDNKEFTYKDYLKGVQDGWIDESVSYEELYKINQEALEMEKAFEESDEFYEVYDSSQNRTIPTLRAGDILITNGTSSYGITGHSAIAISSSSVLHIAGPNEFPSTPNTNQFYEQYNKKGYIKVYRPLNSIYGIKAAQWAEKTYKYSRAKYKISTNLTTTNETYCSKIVFQAYKYGVGKDAFTNSKYYNKTNVIVMPYSLSKYVKSNLIANTPKKG